MKTLLVGINAKFIHSNLAIRSISEYAKSHYELSIEICEFTINQRCEFILAEIFKKQPDILGFSCYIWNYEMIRQLVSQLKKVLPHTLIFLGGPEVSYHAPEVLSTTQADFVLSGEGEKSCPDLIRCIETQGDYSQVGNLTYKTQNGIVSTPQAPLLSMDELPFVYEDMSELEHRILYYESMRGCPFHCQYCLSCTGDRVRFMSLPRVFSHLDFFLKKRVRQVKFVDRTFNCNKQYALAIWKYLKEHDNGYTNFHFEIAAELLDDEILDFLPTVRKGFFQFEIGVQSTNPLTLEHIQRKTDIDKLRTIIKRLQKGKNIHLHLDLIIGLPFEDYETFKKSFNDVYALAPDQLQVGFLKLLRGSGLYENQAKYDMVASEYAPYEILSTHVLPFSQLLKLKMIEEMVEIYYNSNRFLKTINYLKSFFDSPFSIFEALAEFYEQNKLHEKAHSNVEYYSILHDFFLTLSAGDDTLFQWLVKFDLYSHEKAKRIPDWLVVSLSEPFKHQILDFYDNPDNRRKYLPQYQELDAKQLYRQAHLEIFPFNPVTGKNEQTAVVFNYRDCDLLGNARFDICELAAKEHNIK